MNDANAPAEKLGHRRWLPAWAVGVFAVDLRSLALLRIGLAISVLADLAMRAGDLVRMYTDHGVLPGDLLVELEGRAVLLSLHYWAGASTLTQALLFAVTAACAVALLLGWRTRAMVAICWYLVSSVQVRLPLAYFGGDSVLRLLLFWSFFLPVGARFSLDRAHGRVAPRPDRLVSPASAALLLQVALIYWATAARKSGPLWWSGQAIFYALHREAWVTPFGEWLRSYPSLLVPLTYATLTLEWLGPCLAFVPSAAGVFRLVAITLFWGFHIGLATMMSIGLFPLVSIVAWLPFVPSSAWAWADVAGSDAPAPPSTASDRLASTAAGVLIVYVFLLLAQRAHVLPPIIPSQVERIGQVLRIQQTWNMFAPDPPRASTTYEIRRVLEDGAVTFEPAAPGFRWTTYLRAASDVRQPDHPLSRSMRRFALLRCGDPAPGQAAPTAGLEVLAQRRETTAQGAGDASTTTRMAVTCDREPLPASGLR